MGHIADLDQRQVNEQRYIPAEDDAVFRRVMIYQSACMIENTVNHRYTR
jgi:hypothetical protein